MPGTNIPRLTLYAAAYLGGNCLLLSMPSLAVAWSVSALLVAALMLPLKYRRLPVVMAVAGFICSLLQVTLLLNESLPLQLAGKVISVDGHIEGLPEKEGRVVRFDLNVFHSENIDGKQIKGRIRVSDYRRNSIDPEPGHAWRLLLRVKPPHGFANPAGFDYEQWLFNQRIIATAYIRDNEIPKTKINGEKITGAAFSGTRVNSRLPLRDLSATIDTLRLRLLKHINTVLSGSPLRGILSALATGDRRAISMQQWSVLQLTGTAHLMAISGLHVGLVAGIFFYLARFLWASIPQLPLLLPDYRAAAIAAFTAACFYSLLAGFSLPTQRALLMLAILTTALVLGRRMRAADTLSLALLLVLIVDPLAPLAAGFWLSFGAVAMILYIMLLRQHRQNWTTGFAAKAIILQWKLSLLIAPFTLLFFQQFSIASPLANLVAIPLVAFFIVPLVLAASLSFLLTGSGLIENYLYQLADVIFQGLWYFLTGLASTATNLTFSTGYAMVAVAGLFFAVLIFMLPPGFPLRRFFVLGVLVFFFPVHADPGEGEYKMILLDVGQGLSAIIITRQHALLFDTGARYSETFNAGQAVVLPVLKSLSIDKLDTLIVSHGDNDHSGGVKSILSGIEVQQLISNEDFSTDNAVSCRAGRQWQWEGVSFRILHPGDKGLSRGNNASCVLHIQSPYGSVLLPADIEKEAEKELLARYPGSLSADILVAPHHGSKTSSSDTFIEAVAPGLVLFPAGWMNRYHHPAKKVLKRLQEYGIASRMTGECGAITIQINKAGISADSWRQTDRKLWDRSETDRRCSRKSL